MASSACAPPSLHGRHEKKPAGLAQWGNPTARVRPQRARRARERPSALPLGRGGTFPAQGTEEFRRMKQMLSLWIIERGGEPVAIEPQESFSVFEEKSQAEYNSDDGDVIVEYRRVKP